METIYIVLFSIAGLCILGMIYSVYQLFRNDAVLSINLHWIATDDDRFDKYTYDEMFKPSKSNWFGIRYPKDSHFKK